MKLAKKLLAVAVMLTLVVSLFAACTGETTSTSSGSSANTQQSSSEAPKEDIHFPFIAPMTGDYSQYGITMHQGIMLRVDEANEAGGIDGRKIVMDVYDDKNDAKETVNIANMIMGDEDLWVVFGPFSTTCAMAIAPLFQKAEILHWALQSSHPDLTKIGDWIFRGTRTQAFETGEFAKYAAETLGAKTYSILYVNNDWGQSVDEIFIEGVTSRGGQVLVNENFVDGQTKDFTPMISKMWAAKPELVFIIAFYNDTATILNQMATLEVDCIKMMASPNVREDTITLAGENVENVYSLAGFTTELSDPLFVAFREKFRATYDGKEVETFSMNAYEAMDFTLLAISQVGMDKYKIKEFLATYKDFHSVSGAWSFDEMRNPSKPLFALQVRNGVFELLD